ncbi:MULTISPECIES: restriction endonuclease subunit S [Enterobacteriaceae]|uniref:restriction endonuclease subunit S n=1 Tax=Enterobacteriaceae TaxID=543 RepID=UPI000D658092|nr:MULTISPECIES: restriction endonuclease subunit S [Enterobacteriaceae]EEI5148269.1 restriction endonuclease subunit S [Salmonella enterica]MJU05773.1 restriction endonuclease subunit S [Salmonella enterica subsp. enterica serovar Bovismorbificans]HAG9122119.1 restriction endonuclease subunit S [Escherichia coli]HBB6761013.1 restriction endonuclease subunit S [Citrobacter amalonaticus]EEP2833147.1 restriction endonuclease subunit S [Salmonella enterica]
MSELSYLEKLLEGIEVEWFPLGKVAKKIYSGGTPDTKKIEYWEHGTIPWMSSGEVNLKTIKETEKFITEDGLNNSSAKFVPENSIVMALAGQGKTRGKVARTRIKLTTNQSLAAITFDERKINSDYIFHFLETQYDNLRQISSGNSGRGGLNLQMISAYKAPIPCPGDPEKSLAIQSEIVRILDKFTALTAELTAELTARKKQYNYYRDQLLSFEEGEVEWKALGEIAAYSKSRISFDKLDENNYVGVDNLLQNRAGKMQSNYVPTSGNLTEFREGDILIGNIRPYLKKIWQADSTGGTNGDVLVIRSCHESILPRYLYQILADENFFEYNMQHAKGAKMPRGNKDAIMKYRLPIPSLNEQTRIVSVLDKFDTLTNSISEGLPREIELRQKQYEYYRDLLFSFPKPETAQNTH